MNIELKYLDEIDPQQLAKHANNQLINKYLRDSFPYPYTIDHALNFIAYTIQNKNTEFAIVVDGVCVGCIGAKFNDDIYKYNCEIGYWISPIYWNKGIMSFVVNLFCFYLFNHYNIHKIYAEVFLENIGSYRVLLKNGFQEEGHFIEHVYKNGEFKDIVLLGLRREVFEYKKNYSL